MEVCVEGGGGGCGGGCGRTFFLNLTFLTTSLFAQFVIIVVVYVILIIVGM